jgi:hypothetical protein
MQPQHARVTFHSGKRFGELTFPQKFRFICKSFVFFVSGGFVFPTMWVD